jgi:hypothetical protein
MRRFQSLNSVWQKVNRRIKALADNSNRTFEVTLNSNGWWMQRLENQTVQIVYLRPAKLLSLMLLLTEFNAITRREVPS